MIRIFKEQKPVNIPFQKDPLLVNLARIHWINDFKSTSIRLLHFSVVKYIH